MSPRIRVLVISALFAAVSLSSGFAEVLTMSRDDCVAKALTNNRLLKISEYDVGIAQALLRQAKSAYWPTLTASGMAGIMDESMVFGYPAAGGSLTVPAGILGPNPVQFGLDVPEQKIKIMDDKIAMGSLNLTYPLYTGGIRKGLNQQAKYGVEYAKEGRRRTELEVVYDVERAYYGAVLTRRMLQISDDTLQRMEATLDLTKRLYEEGSGRVKKTDYLRNKTVVELVRSTKAAIKARQVKADTALINLMGLSRGLKVEPAEKDLPAVGKVPDLNDLISMALEFNPDLGRVRAGIGAYRGKLMEAHASYKPKIGLFAKYIHFENESDSGMMHPQNKDMAAIGIGGEFTLFEGFRNKNRVLGAQLELEKLKAQEDALIEGVTIWVEHAYAELEGAMEKEVSTGDALQAASENRDLNVRAYQEELVETADVIEAQMMEAFIEANYQKTLYEYIEVRARLSKLVGSES